MYITDLINSRLDTYEDAELRRYGLIGGTITDVSSDGKLAKARYGKQDSKSSTDWMITLHTPGSLGVAKQGDLCLIFPHDGNINRGYCLVIYDSKTSNPEYEAVHSEILKVVNQLSQIVTTALTHTHPTPSGTSGPPTELAAYVGQVPKAKMSDGSTPTAQVDTTSSTSRLKVFK